MFWRGIVRLLIVQLPISALTLLDEKSFILGLALVEASSFWDSVLAEFLPTQWIAIISLLPQENLDIGYWNFQTNTF